MALSHLAPLPQATTLPLLEVQAPAPGLAGGSVVLTRDGALPVEFLEPGDAVITRSGLRRVMRIESRRHDQLGLVQIEAGALAPGRPEVALTLAAGQDLVLRDGMGPGRVAPRHDGAPRSGALRVRSAQLIGAPGIRVEILPQVRVYRLIFERPEVIYVGGMELLCDNDAVEVR